MLWELLKLMLICAGLFSTALGLLVIFHIVRPQEHPADATNRINKIRLIWLVLTREDKFVQTFPWLKRDEWENVSK